MTVMSRSTATSCDCDMGVLLHRIIVEACTIGIWYVQAPEWSFEILFICYAGKVRCQLLAMSQCRVAVRATLLPLDSCATKNKVITLSYPVLHWVAYIV